MDSITRSLLAHPYADIADPLDPSEASRLTEVEIPNEFTGRIFTDFGTGQGATHAHGSSIDGRADPEEDKRNAAAVANRKGDLRRANAVAGNVHLHKKFAVCAHGESIITPEQLAKLEKAIERKEELAKQIEADANARVALEVAAQAGTLARDAEGNIAATREEAVTDGETLEDVATDAAGVEERAIDVLNKTDGQGLEGQRTDASAREIIADVRDSVQQDAAEIAGARNGHEGHDHGPDGQERTVGPAAGM